MKFYYNMTAGGELLTTSGNVRLVKGIYKWHNVLLVNGEILAQDIVEHKK